jgi:hypothetical protein
MADTETIVAFVLRARRIEAHSLLRDRDRFAVWASGAMRVELTQDQAHATTQSARVYFDLPEEEVFESLASRVRPMLLKKEPVYFGRVLNIIEPHVGNQEGRDEAAAIRNSWERASQRSDALGYSVNGTPDATLAFAWLYGDLVHADDTRQQAAGLSIDHRYRAAVLVFGAAAVAAVGTLNLIRQVHRVGAISLPESAFIEPVTADPNASYPVRGVAFGPVGKPAEELGRLLDDAYRDPQPD